MTPGSKNNAPTAEATRVFAVDLHVHTGFVHAFPGRPTPFDPLGLRLACLVARARGLDAIAVTNHDFSSPLPDSLYGVGIVPGIEISTTQGHLLVVGPNPPTRTEPGALDPHEAVDLAHERGCAAVLAHPFRNSTLRDVDAPFDAVELNAKRPGQTGRVVELARERVLPLVGASDAHVPLEVGTAYTLVNEAPTAASIVEAIRTGEVDVHVETGLLPLLRDRVYGFVHRLRGHG